MTTPVDVADSEEVVAMLRSALAAGHFFVPRSKLLQLVAVSFAPAGRFLDDLGAAERKQLLGRAQAAIEDAITAGAIVVLHGDRCRLAVNPP